MIKTLKIIGIILAIITFVAGVTNPDTTAHLNKRLEKVENLLEQDTLLRNITYKNSILGIDVKQRILNAYRELESERKNYILFSKIDFNSIGALNYVWIIDNRDASSIRKDLFVNLSNLIHEKFNDRYYSDVVSICNEALKGAPEGYKLNTLVVRDGYFNSMRARSNFYLKNSSLALEDIKIIEKAKLADDWAFYTAYLAYDKIGNKKKAFEYINKAIDKNSKEGSYYYWRAYLYHDFGNRDQACSDMHKAQTLGYDVAPSSIQYYCLY